MQTSTSRRWTFQHKIHHPEVCPVTHSLTLSHTLTHSAFWKWYDIHQSRHHQNPVEQIQFSYNCVTQTHRPEAPAPSDFTCSYLFIRSLVSGGYPPLCPFPSMLLRPSRHSLRYSSAPRNAAGQNKLLSTTCRLKTPFPPKSLPSKITTRVQRANPDEAAFSRLLCLSLPGYMDRWHRGQQSGRERRLSASGTSRFFHQKKNSWVLADRNKDQHWPLCLFCSNVPLYHWKSKQSDLKGKQEVDRGRWERVQQRRWERVQQRRWAQGRVKSDQMGDPDPNCSATTGRTWSPPPQLMLIITSTHTHKNTPTRPQIVQPMKGCTGLLGMPSVT